MIRSSKIPLHEGNLQESTSVSKEQLQFLFSSHCSVAVGGFWSSNVFLWILNSSSATCDWTKSCQWKKQHDISYIYIIKDLCVWNARLKTHSKDEIIRIYLYIKKSLENHHTSPSPTNLGTPMPTSPPQRDVSWEHMVLPRNAGA